MDYRCNGYRVYLAYSGKWVVMMSDTDGRTRRKFKTQADAEKFANSLPAK